MSWQTLMYYWAIVLAIGTVLAIIFLYASLDCARGTHAILRANGFVCIE
jgi:hypothetical protein